MNLENNTILITGGSSGIGLAFAKAFVELGNEVIVTGRNAEKLANAAKEVPGLHTIRCDAADPDAIAAMADQVKRDHPKINVLMNNAGIFLYKNLSQDAPDLARLTAEVDINISGPIRTVSALIEPLKENRGTIINVSSGLAFVPFQCAPVYCATKAAMHSYTLSLRQQLTEHGVTVVELMPPAVKTEMTAELPQDGDFKVMTTDVLVKATLKGLRANRNEIRPGQANQLHWMSRIAPGFINAQLAKASKPFIPAGTPKASPSK